MPIVSKLVCVSLCTTVNVPEDMEEEDILKTAYPGLIQNLYDGGIENLDLIRTDDPTLPNNSLLTVADADTTALSPTGDISKLSQESNLGFLIVCAGGIVQDVYGRTPVKYVLVDYSNVDYSRQLMTEDVEDGGPFDGVRYASLVDGSMSKVFSDNMSGIRAHPSVHQFLANKMEEIGF